MMLVCLFHAQMWLLFVRHYFYRSLITTDAKRELTWETFIQGCF